MGRSVKKGPFVDPEAPCKNCCNEREERKERTQDLVKSFHNIP